MKMTLLATEYLTEIERQTDFYLTRIRQIDKILAGPVKTLIALGEQGRGEDNDIQKLFYFPTWISEISEAEKKDHLLTQSVCCATLQRLWRLRRRFFWLEKYSDEQTIDALIPRKTLAERLQVLHKKLARIFKATPSDKTTPLDFEQSLKLLNSETLGGLNPLTASQVFRVLMEAGEDRTHAGLGFLAFFAIVWPLCRRFPDPLTIGVRIEPWEVTAYGTAKCVIPIRILQKVINTRAQLLERVDTNLKELEKLATQVSSRKRWEFNVQLDDLGANLRHLSNYSIDSKAFRNCATKVEEESLRAFSNREIYEVVLDQLGKALLQVRDTSGRVWQDARTMVDAIRLRISEPLKTIKADRLPDPESYLVKELGLRFSQEHLKNPDYWKDLAKAAQEAGDYCDQALKELEVGGNICKGITNDSPTIERSVVSTALTDLANANRSIGQVMDEPVKDASQWCRNIVDREIAHASAENLTDFDPSELVSAIAVAVAWDRMTTQLQVSDAVTKAIAGARGDGSWRSGKPFYSSNYAAGIWAGTSDIVWTLTSAIEQFPDVTEADEELFNYINWLERTQITVIPKPAPVEATSKQETENTVPESGSPGSETSRKCNNNYVGWTSERLRDRRKINLLATAFSINALLEIRDLVEYRLWQLCKRRFSVVSIDKLLKDIDPVDLGAFHSKRLHWRLARMAPEAQRSNYKSAKYSLLLHGPPGSSKTKMAEALSAEMWKSSRRWGPMEPRLLRITPADFTRLGEDRLDSEARVIFDLIGGVRAVTIFFDEIDDLLRQRNTVGDPPRFMDLVTPAMLNRLADLRSACPRQEICFLLATNYVENIDSALIRKGRIDDSIAVVYPDFESRTAIISSYRQDLPAGPLRPLHETFTKIVRNTAGWPYLDIKLCCDIAKPCGNVSGDNGFATNLEKAIQEHRWRCFRPDYVNRQRYTWELLNERLHHIISCCESREECRSKCDLIGDEATSAFPIEDIKEILELILNKEERWPAVT